EAPAGDPEDPLCPASAAPAPEVPPAPPEVPPPKPGPFDPPVAGPFDPPAAPFDPVAARQARRAAAEAAELAELARLAPPIATSPAAPAWARDPDPLVRGANAELLGWNPDWT